MERIRVVFDVNVFIDAVAGGDSPFEVWPSPLPVSDNVLADCVGIVNDARDVILFVSEHILDNVVSVLIEEYGWDPDTAVDYEAVILEMVQASGGILTTPSQTVTDCIADYEDNRILEVALEVDAVLIVSNDHHLLDMTPWRGRPVVTPSEFAHRIDVMRRKQGGHG